jgi:hypothetical protein
MIIILALNNFWYFGINLIFIFAGMFLNNFFEKYLFKYYTILKVL